ncbi:MAG: hypothetical protein R8N50_04030 [Alphaproteobacteria bacterium]|nr:hypothetical protein [Alphaproteobacteria bacterium]
MKKNKSNLFSTWILWSPLKFAAISFGIMITTALIYSLIANAVYGPQFTSQTPMLILLTLGFLGAIAIQIQTLPRRKMDRASFITIHNTQTIILSTLFIIASYLLARHSQQIIFYLLIMETKLSNTFLIILTASLLFFLYLSGLLFANFYAKFRRIREFNIPVWKIICSMPFGFSALWTPGYLLDSETAKNPTYAPKSKYLNRASNWIISRPAHTISTFIVITTLSGFFFGFNSVLLTFSLTLIFGIWALQRGAKNFAKKMPEKYANYTVILNLVLLTLFIGFFTLVPSTTQNAQLTISDTGIVEVPKK